MYVVLKHFPSLREITVNPKKISCMRLLTSDKKPDFQSTIEIIMNNGEICEKKILVDDQKHSKEIYFDLVKQWHTELSKKSWLSLILRDAELVTVTNDYDVNKISYVTFNLASVEFIEFQQKEEMMDAEITYIHFHMSNGKIITKRYDTWKGETKNDYNNYVEKWEKLI